MARNKPSLTDRNRKAIAGIQQHYAGAQAIVLDGVSFKPADVAKIFQDHVDAADKTAAARVTFHQTVAAENAANAKANATFLALKTREAGARPKRAPHDAPKSRREEKSASPCHARAGRSSFVGVR